MLICIAEERNNSNIILAYRIQDTVTGQVGDFEARELKNYIKRGMLQVVNLRLTTDNRLIKHRVEKVYDKTPHYVIHDGAGLSVQNKPKYTNEQQEYINKIMKKETKSKKSAFDFIENIFSMFEKPKFKVDKERYYENGHDYASYDDEIND